jgi:prepilin-type processing-associated H-X9-DG protein
VTDGLSNTLFVGEYHTKNTSNRGTFWGYTYTSYSLSDASPISTTLLPDFANCIAQAPSSDAQNPCKRAWGALHSGNAINFLLADGSCRTISPNIDVTSVWLALATIAGGEIIGDF